jgi:hypothetical protein
MYGIIFMPISYGLHLKTLAKPHPLFFSQDGLLIFVLLYLSSLPELLRFFQAREKQNGN